MNKIFTSIALLCTVAFFCSCSNEDNIGSNNSQKEIEVVENGSILKFKDQATLIKTIESLRKVENLDFGIRSLYSIYDEAMEEADKAYVSEDTYNAFKQKYEGSLLFFEYEDDYSAYLPVSSEDIAKILNSEGKVMIGEEIKDFKDIHSYQDLQNANIAWIENESQLRSNTYETPYEYSGNGKFKIRVKINNTPQRDPFETVVGIFPGYTTGVLHFEITYRFKGFLGRWYNHKSNVTFTAHLTTKNYNKSSLRIEDKEIQVGPQHTYDTSSIDHWFDNYSLEYKGTMRVQYSGIDKTWDVERNYD